MRSALFAADLATGSSRQHIQRASLVIGIELALDDFGLSKKHQSLAILA